MSISGIGAVAASAIASSVPDQTLWVFSDDEESFLRFTSFDFAVLACPINGKGNFST
jgi:hypothetical protein